MKLKTFLFVLGLIFLFTITAFSQNKSKHIGCWKITKLDIAFDSEETNKTENEAKNTIICLFEDGTFTNQNANKDIPVLKGFYSVSADGKTFSQRRDVDAKAEDAIPMDILLLNDKEFIVEAEGIAKMTLQKIK